ncbi:MAG TPA: ATP-binding protein [Puia sp.]|nr:ATP-binding protein [Puia sp.]
MTQDTKLTFTSFDYFKALTNHPKENSVLFISPNGIVQKVNRAFLLSFGYAEHEVVGQHLDILFTEEDRQKDKPGREIKTVLDEGQCSDNNYLVNKDKTLTWVSGESILIRNDQGEKCVLKIIQNIHTQKESENSIVQLNVFNENILSSIEDAVIVLGSDHDIVKANQSFFKLFAPEQEDLAKINFNVILQSFDSPFSIFKHISNAFRPGAVSSRMQAEFNGNNGSDKKVFDISFTRLNPGDGLSNLVIIFHDVTTQKLFEKQIEDILNFVGHELRNPLTSVILSIELMEGLLKEKDRPELSGALAIARNNARRINKLVKELYNSSSVSSGNLNLQGNEFDFVDMVTEAIHSTRQIHPAFTIALQSSEACSIYGDRDKLIQVVTNYLSNAIKYSKDSLGIEVTIRCEENAVILSVRDHGVGIPAKELPYIFNRFFRAEKTKDLEGLGLGLFLCRQIIKSHNGHTWAESLEGKGSTFYFSVPINPVDIL